MATLSLSRRLVAALIVGCLVLGIPGPGAYSAFAATVSQAAGASRAVSSVPAGLGSNLSGPGSRFSLPSSGLTAPGRPGFGPVSAAPSIAPGVSLSIPAATIEAAPPILGAPADGVLRGGGAAAPAGVSQPTVLEAAQAAQAGVETVLASPESEREDASAASSRAFDGLLAEDESSLRTLPELSLPEAGGEVRSALSRRVPSPIEGLTGKTVLYVVSKMGGRDYLYDNMLRLSREHGFDLLVLGYPDQMDAAVSRGIAPEDFIGADIGDRSAANIASVVEKVKAAARTRPIHGVQTYLNSHALLAAELAASMGLPGSRPEAVRAAHSKIRARRLMNAYADPSIHLPAFEARTQSEARQAFQKIAAEGYARVVAKPDSGGGGWGVVLDIESPDEAAAAFREIRDRIDELVAANPRKARGKQLDQKPVVLFEGQIPDGIMLDVEMVVRNGRAVFEYVSYNPPALGNQERGTTYPAALTPEMAELAKSQALKALDAVGYRNGNAHVEIIITHVKGRMIAPIVEINARMGGADVWASIQESAGVDLMKEGLLASLGIESKVETLPAPRMLQHRFLIAKTGGRLKAVHGLPEASKEVFLSELFVSIGDKVEDRDLLGNVTIRGTDERASRDRLYELLRGVEIEIETADHAIVRQTGLYSHDTDQGRLLVEDWVDRIGFELAGWLGKIKSLPRSFLTGFVPAWTVNAMAQEIQAVALPLFSAVLFGLPAALMISGLGYLTRIAGAWLGSSSMERFNPKWVNVTAIISLALGGVPIAAAAFFGASSSALFAAFLVNAVIQGLVYGINRGVAENLLPRMIIGNHHPAKLELGLNFAYQWVEVSCIVMALFVAVPMLNLLGGTAMVVISSVGIGSSALLYATLKFREPWRKAEDNPKTASQPQAASRPSAQEAKSSLGLREYLPYAFFRFMHFMVYGVMATVLALAVFSSPEAAGTVIGLYAGGSWLASLLASLSLLPTRKLGRKGWTLLGGLAATAFMWSALAGVPVLTYALGGLLGGLITINSNKWMAYYSHRLSQGRFRNLSKWMMTASILAMLPVFAAVSLARILPAVAAVVTMTNLLLGASVLVTLAAVVMAVLLLKRAPARS